MELHPAILLSLVNESTLDEQCPCSMSKDLDPVFGQTDSLKSAPNGLGTS
jgi:hypothetical protein